VTAPTRIVGVRGHRVVEYNSSSFQELDYILSRFIATGPISLAWEKIPFSFVVDWFVDLSGLIQKLDNTLTGNRKVVEKCWSSETHHAFLAMIARESSSESNALAGQVVAQAELKTYLRNPLEPVSLIQSRVRFGKKQAASSVALLHQKVANLVRRLRR
jgi:hypothetical protein